MYSRSPSRNHRSRGIKVKHILQICLLVAVCFWLIYQVKRSHEKKTEFDENDAKLASEIHSGSGIIKLGRKDIPKVTEAGGDDKLHAVDDEENEADEQDEQEREEGRTEDREEGEDTGKAGADDEMDKHEEEKIDGENHEEFVDGEKEREEGDEKNEDNEEKEREESDEKNKDNEEREREEGDEKNKDNEERKREEGDEKNTDNDDGGKEDNGESETVLEDQDQEGGDGNTHEAREEHYKADDASSEVAHDTRTIMPNTDNATVKHTDGSSELINEGMENVNKSSNQSLLQENSGLQIKEHEATEGANSSYSGFMESKEYKDNLTISEYSSSGNSTSLTESSDQSQASSNSTKFETQSANMTRAQNATYEESHNDGSNVPVSLLSHANTSDVVSDKKQMDINTIMNFTQHVNNTSEGSLGSSGEVKLAIAENITDPTGTNAYNVTAGEDEGSISDTSNDITGADQHDHVGDFDSSLTQKEKEYQTDLGTLPDIKVEVEHPDEVEAE